MRCGYWTSVYSVYLSSAASQTATAPRASMYWACTRVMT